MKGRADEALTRWVLEESVSFSHFMSPGLQEFVRNVNPNYKIPHRTTIRKRVRSLCESPLILSFSVLSPSYFTGH